MLGIKDNVNAPIDAEYVCVNYGNKSEEILRSFNSVYDKALKITDELIGIAGVWGT